MSQDVTPAALTPSSGLSLLPARSHPDLPRALGRPRRHSDAPDAVVFDAACPVCGITAKWSEARVDTHVEIKIACHACDERERERLPASA